MNAGGGGRRPSKRGGIGSGSYRGHSTGVSNRGYGGGSSSSNKSGVCFDFQKNGSCRFGSNCRFVHSTVSSNNIRGGNKRGPNNTGKSKSSSNNDSQRLIKQLKNTKQNQLVDAIVKAGSLWPQCWECASSSLSPTDIEALLHIFAKIPFSQENKVDPPPIYAVKGVIKKYLNIPNTTGPQSIILLAETTLNVVRKLLSFEWEDKSKVKDILAEILEDAAGHLQRRYPDHRDTLHRIDECLDSLDKPWQIKGKLLAPTATIPIAENEDEQLVPFHHFSKWKNASVAWLCYGPTFSPSSNPKMQGPSTKSQGIYKSREHYFETMQRLMIAMAFCEGHKALAPKCWEKANGGSCCGSTLVQISDQDEGEIQKGGDKKGSPLICRGKHCNNSPKFICKISSHGRGLCVSCAIRETDQLLGPTGSTHVYNGHVDRVGTGGRLYIQGFQSRKPPMDETGTTLFDYPAVIVHNSSNICS